MYSTRSLYIHTNSQYSLLQPKDRCQPGYRFKVQADVGKMRFLHFAYEAHTQKKQKLQNMNHRKIKKTGNRHFCFFVFSSDISSFFTSAKASKCNRAHEGDSEREKPSESPQFHFYQQVRDLDLSLQPQQITAKEKRSNPHASLSNQSRRVSGPSRTCRYLLHFYQSGVCDSGPDICNYDPRGTKSKVTGFKGHILRRLLS